MTGPEHYREAEKDIALANSITAGGDPEASSYFLARAQVHATLAHAAAAQATVDLLTEADEAAE